MDYENLIVETRGDALWVTLNRPGKTRRTRTGTGKRKDTKRAIVTLSKGTIDIFGGPVA